MEHAFGKIVAILLAAATACIIPLMIHMARVESMVQLSIMTDTVQFVDNVRNHGYMTREMYERYQSTVMGRRGGLDIQLVHMRDAIHMEQGKVVLTEKVSTTEEIMEQLYEEQTYSFEQGEFFRVEVKKGAPGWMDSIYQSLLRSELVYPECYVYYGGSIRYED